MKWFLVVVSLVSTNPDDDRDMWVIQKSYDSAGHCSYEASISGLGLMAKAHQEFDYSKKFPEIQPWDAWAVRCVTEEQLMNVITTPKLGA
jgi:glucokinase